MSADTLGAVGNRRGAGRGKIGRSRQNTNSRKHRKEPSVLYTRYAFKMLIGEDCAKHSKSLLCIIHLSYADHFQQCSRRDNSGRGADAWLDKPDDPRASLVLVPGKGGLSENDPLLRVREKIAENGFAVLSIGKTTNIRAAMRQMAQIAKPVYLAAVSQGVSRVGVMMSGGKFKTKGLVLIAGNLNFVRGKVQEKRKLSRTLVIHHRRDDCNKTPPSAVTGFKDWGGDKVSVEWLDGGHSSGGACGPDSHHGLSGLDDELVNAIANFLR